MDNVGEQRVTVRVSDGALSTNRTFFIEVLEQKDASEHPDDESDVITLGCAHLPRSSSRGGEKVPPTLALLCLLFVWGRYRE